MRPLFPPLVMLSDPQDDVEAMKLYQKEADQGDAVAQYHLGLMYEFGIEGVLPPDGIEAMEWYLKAAQQGNDEALNAATGFSSSRRRRSPANMSTACRSIPIPGGAASPARNISI